MPISSFPISVRSSVNLSDINIDTDLDMGANSIIGYAKNEDIPQIRDLSATIDSLYKLSNHNTLNLPTEVVAGGTGAGQLYTTTIYNDIVSATNTLDYFKISFNLKHSTTHPCSKTLNFYIDGVFKDYLLLSPTTSYVLTTSVYTDISIPNNKPFKLELALSTGSAGSNYVYVKDVFVDLYTKTAML